MELLTERASGLRLTEWHIRLRIAHTGLTKGIPGELPLGSVVINLEVLLITTGEGGKSGLIAMGPILQVERGGEIVFNVILVDAETDLVIGAMKRPAV